MRRRTRLIALGALGGALLMLLASLAIYYFFGYRNHRAAIKNYQLLVNTYKNPPSQNALRLTRSLNRYDVLSTADVALVKLPVAYGSEALLKAPADAVGLSVNDDLAAGTLLYDNMVFSAEALPKDLRVYEMSHLITQSTLQVGDAVDIRISFPSGLDYIVLSKKTLIDRRVIEDGEAAEICVFHLDEDEILRLSSALVDAYLHRGTYLYTTRYVSDVSQAGATVTYPANADVQALIAEDPNIVERAMVALEEQKRLQLVDSLNRLPANLVRTVPQSALPQTEQPEEETTVNRDDAELNVGEVN